MKARKRYVSRRDLTDPVLAKLPPVLRAVRLALIELADCYGRGCSDPKWIHANAFAEVAKGDQPDLVWAMGELERRGRLRLYRDLRGRSLYELTDWWKEQTLHKASRPVYPGPEEVGPMKNIFDEVLEQWRAAWRETYGDDYTLLGQDKPQLGIMLREINPEKIPHLPAMFRAYLRDRRDKHVVLRNHPLCLFVTQGGPNMYGRAASVTPLEPRPKNTPAPAPRSPVPDGWAPVMRGNGSR